MRRKNTGTLFTTLGIICGGAVCLALSMTQIMGAIQKDLSGAAQLTAESKEVEEQHIEADDEESSRIIEELKRNIDRKVKLYSSDSTNYNTNTSDDVMELPYVYEGQEIKVRDGLLTEAEALENATKVMDFIYSYVDEAIFQTYGIDKNAYSYKIQRQFWRTDTVYYAVFLLDEDAIMASVGVELGEEPVMISFTRDGIIGGASTTVDIPDEYLIKNWCATTEQREAIYAEYYDKSKDVVENVLGLAAIREDVNNVDSVTYFDVGDTWSTVTFGYVLEDGMYVKVFYNKINGMFDGYAIAGYYEGE